MAKHGGQGISSFGDTTCFHSFPSAMRAFLVTNSSPQDWSQYSAGTLFEDQLRLEAFEIDASDALYMTR